MLSRAKIKEIVHLLREDIERIEVREREISKKIEKTMDMEEITAIAGLEKLFDYSLHKKSIDRS